MKKFILGMAVFLFSSQLLADNIARRFLLNSLTSRTNSTPLKLAAIEGLKGHINANETQRALMNIIQNPRLNDAVRNEAIIAMIADSRNSRTYRAFISLYTREKKEAVKVTLLKSLYLAASNSQVSKFLFNIIQRETNSNLRKAAIFGLLASINSSRDARVLMDILADRNEDAEVRIEAFKNLSFGISKEEKINS